MERREFLKLSAYSLLMTCLSPVSAISAETKGRQRYRFNSGRLPVLLRVDTLVIGGGFAGIGAATKLAKGGKRVMVIDTKTFLGDEVTAFSNFAPGIDAEFLSQFADCIEDVEGDKIVNPIKIKRQTEALLHQNNIDILYGTTPINIQGTQGAFTVVIANKSGLQAVVAKNIVDATPTTISQYLIKGKPVVKMKAQASVTIEMTNCNCNLTQIALPDRFGIKNNIATVKKGYLGAGHRFIELTMICKDSQQAESVAKINSKEVALRQSAHSIAKYLINSIDGFAESYYVHLDYYIRHEVETIEHETVCPGVWVAHPVVGGYCAGDCFSAGYKIADSILASAKGDGEASKSIYKKSTETTFAYLTNPIEGIEYDLADISSFELDTAHQYDVVVAGGGTSGATAAAVASRNGLKTLMIEQIHGLGGTGTFGGVHIYWFGRRGGFNTNINKALEAEQKAMNYSAKAPDKWSVEIKNHILCKELTDNNCDMAFHSFVCATIVDKGVIKGVVAATPYGLQVIESKYVIDATGDGDVAAFAGAKFTYGAGYNHFPMYYAFCYCRDRGNYRTKFDAMLDTTNVFDINRVIKTNRKIDVDCDHAPFVATRETRHIHGDKTLTLEHQYGLKQWNDVANIHFSNNDIKGHHSSDWLRLGFQQPNYEVEIPYSALLPQQLDNIIVVGKAFSVEHDAFPTLRMQPDLENLGGVAAMACFEANCCGVSLRSIKIKQLQRRLVELDILPYEVLTREINELPLTETQIEGLIDKLDNKPLYSYSNMPMEQAYKAKIPFIELCMAGDRARAALERRLENRAQDNTLVIVRILAFLGSDKGADILIDEINSILDSGALPTKGKDIPHSSHTPPNQCAMPELGYMLNTLAMYRTEKSLPVWQRVVSMLTISKEALKEHKSGMFYYVDALCYGISLLPSAQAIALLENLHSHELFNSRSSSTTSGEDFMDERAAMLELEICSALSHCGSRRGYIALTEYLDDNRAILARYAYCSLKKLSDKDYGRDKAQWQRYISSLKEIEPIAALRNI